MLINAILKSQIIHDRWKSMKIKSLYKNKGSRNEMKNRRGVFITSIVSKIFEKIIYNRNMHHVNEILSPFQCGSRPGRGVSDHLFTLRAVIDEYRYYKRNLYIFYGDLEKCFDKLWLEDTINELWKSNMPANEVKIIHEMYKEAKIIIDTPIGMTDEIEVQNIVKQGTIYGPTLCSISTDKINRIEEKPVTTYGDNLNLDPMTYVDDIIGIGTKQTVEKVIKNCRLMESKKKMTFNNTKSQYQVLQFSNEKPKEINESVKKGKITRTYEYKYLGDIVDERAARGKNINMRISKTNYIVAVIKNLATNTGFLYINVIKKLYHAIAKSRITYNTETWTNMKVQEINELEKMQKYILTRLYCLPKTTPYLGLLSEIGIWTVEKQIEFKKLMLLQTLLKSDKNRVARKVLFKQIEMNKQRCWYAEIVEIARKNEIELNVDDIQNMTKNEWKQKVKNCLDTKMQQQIDNEGGRKTRYVKKEHFIREEYLKLHDTNTVVSILKIRLNMIDLKCNYKGYYMNDLKCSVCKEHPETTEHMFKCIVAERVIRNNDKTDINDMLSDDVERLLKLNRYVLAFLELKT